MLDILPVHYSRSRAQSKAGVVLSQERRQQVVADSKAPSQSRNNSGCGSAVRMLRPKQYIPSAKLASAVCIHPSASRIHAPRRIVSSFIRPHAPLTPLRRHLRRPGGKKDMRSARTRPLVWPPTAYLGQLARSLLHVFWCAQAQSCAYAVSVRPLPVLPPCAAGTHKHLS
ncbi:hypothetical protein FRC12_006410 [Ceratobasidium sp. 428]|nr:hypothetical protein FRC12_006410 [Ceratobasidium sp. 428]